LEFINACFPENIKTITYKELNDNLMKQGAKREEGVANIDDYYSKYTKELGNGFSIKLKLHTDSTKNTILHLALSGSKGLSSYVNRVVNKHDILNILWERDTLSELEYEKIVTIINTNDLIVSKQQKIISDVVINKLKKIYPIVNQEPQESSIERSGKYTERTLWWIWTKGQIEINDISDERSVYLRESNFPNTMASEYYIKNKNTIRIEKIGWKEIAFDYMFNVND